MLLLQNRNHLLKKHFHIILRSAVCNGIAGNGYVKFIAISVAPRFVKSICSFGYSFHSKEYTHINYLQKMLKQVKNFFSNTPINFGSFFNFTLPLRVGFFNV